MTKETTAKSDRAQLKKFQETAKQVETDNSAESFDRALKKIASQSAKKVEAQK